MKAMTFFGVMYRDCYNYVFSVQGLGFRDLGTIHSFMPCKVRVPTSVMPTNRV